LDGYRIAFGHPIETAEQDWEIENFRRMKEKSEKYYANNENLRFQPISAEEEKRLFRLAKKWKSGEPEALAARDFLVTNHLLWVSQISKRLAKGRLSEDEVISAGNDALMKAIEGFDPERGVRFRPYLGPFIRGAISDLWRSKNPVNYKNHFPKESNDGSFKKSLVDETVDHPFEAADHDDYLKSVLRECISDLSERDQELLREVAENGKSFADIGRERGTSRAAPQAGFTRAIRRLREAFRKRGITSL